MKKRNLAPGYSLIELQVVMVLIGIVAAISVFALQGAIPSMWADGAMDRVSSFMRQARDTAITQRRRIQVQFTGATQIDLIRLFGNPPFPVIGTAVLESRESFVLTPGLPDTPDGYGNLTAIDFGAAANVRFNPDGTLTDFNSVPVNGTIFVGVPGNPILARAVTITGVTGRAQAYRWNGMSWEER